MRAGISTASLFLRKNNEDALAFLDASGVETAEVFLTSFCEYKQDFATLLAKQKGNVAVNSVHILVKATKSSIFMHRISFPLSSSALIRSV